MQSLFILIDIDNTLYEFSATGFHNEMHERIFAFAKQKLGLTGEEAEQLSRRYWLSYGLSLYGYVKDYHVNAKEYSDFVHQCSYEKLHYNAPLVMMLQSMQYTPALTQEPEGASRKGVDHLYYFTNANRSHARNVLDAQGLRCVFSRRRPVGSPLKEHHRADDDVGFEEEVEWIGFSYEDQWRLTAPNIANKPMRRAYEAIYKAIEDDVGEDAARVSAATADVVAAKPHSSSLHPNEVQNKQAHLRPENFVMVDDSLMNLAAPLELGWSAVWYAHDNLELPTDETQDSRVPAYAAAVASGRLQVIRSILELKEAVERIRCVNSGAHC